MEKKLTKKELKEMETKQEQLRKDRDAVINAVKGYWADIEATERYYKINCPEKLSVRGYLLSDEKEKLLRRYECLNFLKLEYEKDDIEERSWSFIRLMIKSKAENNIYRKEEHNLIIDQYTYLNDGVWNDDIIWNDEQMKLYMRLAKRFGYKYFIYTNASTGALGNISVLIKLGASIVDTCTTRYYDDELRGLVFDISNVNVEEDKEVD